MTTNGARPLLYDPATRCFDPSRLDLALVLRKIPPARLYEHAKISEGAAKNARAGRPLRERTVIAVLEVLNGTEAMAIGADCVD